MWLLKLLLLRHPLASSTSYLFCILPFDLFLWKFHRQAALVVHTFLNFYFICKHLPVTGLVTFSLDVISFINADIVGAREDQLMNLVSGHWTVTWSQRLADACLMRVLPRLVSKTFCTCQEKHRRSVDVVRVIFFDLQLSCVRPFLRVIGDCGTCKLECLLPTSWQVDVCLSGINVPAHTSIQQGADDHPSWENPGVGGREKERKENCQTIFSIPSPLLVVNQIFAHYRSFFFILLDWELGETLRENHVAAVQHFLPEVCVD